VASGAGQSMSCAPGDGRAAILGFASRLGLGGGRARAGLVDGTRVRCDCPLGLRLKPFSMPLESSSCIGMRTALPLARIAMDSASRCVSLKLSSHVLTTSSIGGAGLGKFSSLQ
jgi:hypothetical protein